MTPIHFALSSAFMMGLAGLAFNRAHLLSALLCLEGMMLILYLALSLWALQLGTLAFFSTPLVLLAFSACEASAGLSLLIATARTHANDNLQNMNLLQC